MALERSLFDLQVFTVLKRSMSIWPNIGEVVGIFLAIVAAIMAAIFFGIGLISETSAMTPMEPLVVFAQAGFFMLLGIFGLSLAILSKSLEN